MYAGTGSSPSTVTSAVVPPGEELLDQPGGGHPVADDDQPRDARCHAGPARPHGAHLELRHPAGRVEGVVGEPVRARPSGTARRRCPGGCGGHPGGGGHRAAAGGDPDRLARRRRRCRRASTRVQLDVRPVVAAARATRRVWAPDWYCASTRPVVRCTGKSAQGCSAAPRWSTTWNRARRRGWRRSRGTSAACPGACRAAGHGQNTPSLLADPLVGDAGVVGPAAGRGPAQLVEDLLRVGRRTAPASRSALGQPGEHVEVAADPGGRVDRPLPQDHPALEVGHGAGLLGPLGDRQHDVGERGGLRQHDVGDHEQVERAPSRRRTWVALGAETTTLLPKTSSACGPAVGAERVEQLVRRARPGRAATPGRTPHTAGDVLARGRVVDHPVAGQLVGLLAVLAAALAVALPGEAAVAAVRPAAQAQRERQVDPGRAPCRCPGCAARRRGR